jgi:hypothetical protein
MATCTEPHHPDHTHEHGKSCGHTAVRHDGHVDYIHDGTCIICMEITSTNTLSR